MNYLKKKFFQKMPIFYELFKKKFFPKNGVFFMSY